MILGLVCSSVSLSWLKWLYDEASEENCESASADARALGLIAHKSEDLLEVAEREMLVTGFFAGRLNDRLHNNDCTFAFSKFLTCSVCNTSTCLICT